MLFAITLMKKQRKPCRRKLTRYWRETHYASAFDWRNYEYTKKPLEFSNTEAGFITFKAWVDDIAEKQGKPL